MISAFKLEVDETRDLTVVTITDPETGALVAREQARHAGEVRFNDMRDAIRGYLAAQRGTATPADEKRALLESVRNELIPKGTVVPQVRPRTMKKK